MFGRDRSKVIREFYEVEVGPEEIALVHMDYSALLVKLRDKVLAFDVADLLGRKEVAEIRKLDYLLFTHDHYDHYNKEATLALYEAATPKIIAPDTIYDDIKGEIPVYKISGGESIAVDELKVTGIEGKHVGPIVLYLLEVGGVKLFHGGDSGYVPLREYRADVAFVPTGKPSPTASPNDAYQMVMDLEPSLIVPIHGAKSQHEDFKAKVERALPEARVLIVEKWKVEKATI